MANYTTTANVVLTVNGKQGQKMMALLEKDAQRLEKAIAKAASAGDKATMKKLQRELNQTKKAMEQLKGTSQSVSSTLARLDKATPKELNRALKTLQQQLNGIQRGTAAWDAHVAKIRMVKAELQKVNATLATQKSLWAKMNGWLNNCQTAIMAVAAAVTGLVMAGRKAVNAYAEMQESLANTQKYTRMTAAEVEELNDIFKGMDTRLAREQLNLLAQEGGRLGYNTVQSVKEYVEAASIINVALVDLGEGATQTIAKLTNIFGVEEIYGVRDAMLKVGSTVNHLSQNCTAAKPYIVEFAQRMAGIGATAKMSIPEIMAFAATLDAHGQKVEMSATALQRTIMALFKKPGEMAKKVGLETNAFIETLNKSTTDGVVMFLEALNRLGEDQALAVLSPLFEDLGLEGARVSSVLSNLSSHLDFLKWQMGEAAQAFRDGTSASNEYAIFNNTVQASIDKARKRVGELAIELGEKLYPLMKHIYTSSSIFLRVLNQLVSFIIEHRKAIVSLITVIGTYYATIGALKVAHIAYTAVVKTCTAIHNLWRIAVIAGRIVVIAFTQGLGAATHAFRLLTATMSANPFGLIAAAVAGLVLLIKNLCDRTSEYQKKLKEAVSTSKSFVTELSKEQRELDILFGKLKAAKQGTKEYKAIKDQIINQYSKYLQGLVNERNEILSLEQAYKRLAAAARIAAKERAINTARENATEAFDDEFGKLVERLQNSLINEGKSLTDAVYIANRVATELKTTGTVSQEMVTTLQAIKGSYQQQWGWVDHPVNIVNKMIGANSDFQITMEAIDKVEDRTNPLGAYTQQQLTSLVADLRPKVQAGQGGRIIIGIGKANPTVITLTPQETADYLNEAEARLSAMNHTTPEMTSGNPDFNMDGYTPYETDRERRAREAEERRREAAERRAQTKAKQEFKDQLNDAKGLWEYADANNTADYTSGLISYSEFLLKKHELEMKYFDDRQKVFEQWHLQEDEDYQELLRKRAEAEQAWAQKNASLSIADLRHRQNAEEIDLQMQAVTPGSAIYQKEEALQVGLFEIRIRYLKQMQAVYNQSSQEWYDYKIQIEEAEAAEQLRRQKALAQKVAEWRKQYEYLSASQRLTQELALLEEAKQKQLLTEEEYLRALADLKRKYAEDYLPQSAKPSSDNKEFIALQKQREIEIVESLHQQGILNEKQYREALARIERKYEKDRLQRARRYGSNEANNLIDIYEAWKKFFDKTGDDGENWANKLGQLAGGVFSIMNAGLQQYTDYVNACCDLQVAKIEKRYNAEIEFAEGNSYTVKKLEKQRDKEIAKEKNEAAKKAYTMQVIMAVAQTAQNAIAAYGAGLQVGGLAGLILAPIAAAMAVAAGALQIATIKKQQQAAEAQGYSEGGFTRPGRKDEVAGVVHAGEWVASQALVNNPRTRPLLEALDYAQRNNTIGSITAADVSRTITAPAVLAGQTSSAPTIVNNTYNQVPPSSEETLSALRSSLSALGDRLNEPFVTVNTVTGDYGIQRAQSEYDKLMKNKAPKSKR